MYSWDAHVLSLRWGRIECALWVYYQGVWGCSLTPGDWNQGELGAGAGVRWLLSISILMLALKSLKSFP